MQTGTITVFAVLLFILALTCMFGGCACVKENFFDELAASAGDEGEIHPGKPGQVARVLPRKHQPAGEAAPPARRHGGEHSLPPPAPPPPAPAPAPAPAPHHGGGAGAGGGAGGAAPPHHGGGAGGAAPPHHGGGAGGAAPPHHGGGAGGGGAPTHHGGGAGGEAAPGGGGGVVEAFMGEAFAAYVP